MKIQRPSAVAAALAILAFGAAEPKSALANGAVLNTATTAQAAATLAYWTPRRLASAIPKHITTARTLSPASGVGLATGPTTLEPGAPPTIAYNSAWAEKLLNLSSDISSDSEVSPTAAGTAGSHYPYTIDRLYPCAGSGCPQVSSSYSNVYNFYPYATVGQLFFTEPGGNFVCSASVIRLNVIATAGHCVSDGNGHFYSNWLFIPAYHAGVAPFGRWSWSRVVVTGPWFNGGGVVPNRQDDALIVLQPNAGQKIGQVTGYLGYQYNAQPTHLTQLGYPCNLDTSFGDCVQSIQFGPIRDDSQVFAGPTNNFEWGSAAFGGASGGPEIQDFGQQPLHPAGTPPSEVFGGNVLIASTSYTYSTSVQVDGGSILAAPGQFGGSLNTFGDLINSVCATNGNC